MTLGNSTGGPAARERGVSAVVGAVLMVAIVVVLASVLGTMALAFEGRLADPAPTANFQAEPVLDGADNGGVPYVRIRHERGEVADGARILIRDGQGGEEEWEDIWMGDPSVDTPDYVHVDGKGSDCALTEVREGTTYHVVYETADGESQIIETIEITEQPSSSPGSYTC
ncbi:type IV pilin [Haloglomus halophilum]|uniref:type IV pilin n=1 Tax=Haloglomus halophilum TaxID=2962672 RepID=UPI0020C9BEB5|nr:type IV pilin N-terminal domain-containing protein [Haloglomus halophilum]